jgi:Fe-S cluster assembly protein SufD
MSTVTTGTEQWIAAFDRLAADLPGAAHTAVADNRRVALARFTRLGMPGPRDEAWRHTPVAALFRRTLAPDAAAHATDHWPQDTAALGSDAVLSFVDGQFDGSQSSQLEALRDRGVQLTPLSSAMDTADASLLAFLNAGLADAEDGTAALNLAFFRDGALLRIGRSDHPPVRIELRFLSTGRVADAARYSRVCVEVDDGAQALLVERHVSLDGATGLSDISTQIRLGRASSLTHAVIQTAGERLWHFGRINAGLAEAASLSLWSLSLGGATARYQATVSLEGAHSAVDLSGVYAIAGRQIADHTLRVLHQAAGTRSEMNYRGLLDGHARGVFMGQVVVPPGIKGANARQRNNNLLLSPHAEAYSRPELSIENDDVQCAHGATVGQQDEAAVFYLRSRGLDEATARSLLSAAFAAEVLKQIPDQQLQRHTLAALAANLPQRLALEGLT